VARRRRKTRLAGDYAFTSCDRDGRYVITRCGRDHSEWCIVDARSRSVVLRRKALTRVKRICARME